MAVEKDFDGGETYISLPQAEVAVIVMDEHGMVLLGKAKDGIDKDRITVPIGQIMSFESFFETSRRLAIEWSGVDVDPQHALFVCEEIRQDQQVHRLVVFVFAKRIGRIAGNSDALWVDVRDLGQYQDDMTDIAVEGFQKLSTVLQRQAAHVASIPKQA